MVRMLSDCTSDNASRSRLRKMLTQVYWIPLDQKGALGIMPRPRGDDWLEDELQALARYGVTFLVSLLEREEEEELGLATSAHLPRPPASPTCLYRCRTGEFL